MDVMPGFKAEVKAMSSKLSGRLPRSCGVVGLLTEKYKLPGSH